MGRIQEGRQSRNRMRELGVQTHRAHDWANSRVCVVEGPRRKEYPKL